MRRYRQKSYRRGHRPLRRRRKTNFGWKLLIFVLIVAGVIFVYKSCSNDSDIVQPRIEEADQQTASDTQPEVIHDEQERPEPPPEPIPEPDPEPEPQDEITDAPDPQAVALIAEADRLIAADEIIAARDKLNEALLSMQLTSSDRTAVKKTLANLSEQWLFSRKHYPGDLLTDTYKVPPGDRLENIGKNFKVPWEILKRINKIQNVKLLRADEIIKIINGPFHVIVYRSTFTMDLYLGHKMYVKSYKVGLGRTGYETPTGRWRVRTGGKLEKPTWTDAAGRRYVADDPDYPLGSRWIALDGLEGAAEGRTGFAVHGTKDPESISTRSSEGCIRLFNGDAIEVYNMLVAGISEVRVVD